jgi:O-antigen/teichoic acid export membrane protein
MSAISMLRIAAQFFVMPILARLLSPHEYGVVSLAMPVVVLLMVFADAGVGQSLIKEDENNKIIWSSSFWMTSIIGLLLSMICLAVSPLVAYGFGEHDLGPVVRALSVIAFLQAISTVPGVLLQKHGRFATIAIIEVSSMVLGLLVALVTALNGLGYWALVFQQLMQFSVRAGLTIPISRYRPLFSFQPKILGEHLRFGRSMLGNNLVLNLSQSLEVIIVGNLLGTAAAGVFSMAFLFARLPSRIIAGPLNFVIYSHLIPYRDDPDKLRSAFLAVTYLVASVVFSGLFLTAVAHEVIFGLVLGPKWLSAGDLFAIVGPFAAFQILIGLTTTIRLVTGHAARQMQMTVEFSVIWSLLLLGIASFGIYAAGLAFGAAVLVSLPRNVLSILKIIRGSAMDYVRAVCVPFFVAVIAAGCYLGALELHYPLLAMLCLYVLLTLAAIVASLLLGRSILKQGAVALGGR